MAYEFARGNKPVVLDIGSIHPTQAPAELLNFGSFSRR